MFRFYLLVKSKRKNNLAKVYLSIFTIVNKEIVVKAQFFTIMKLQNHSLTRINNKDCVIFIIGVLTKHKYASHKDFKYSFTSVK